MSDFSCSLFYVHDPMCSWCWGYKPTLNSLESLLPRHIELKYLLGGLAVDSSVAMPDDMQYFLQQTWHKIAAQLGTQFNHDFWRLNKPRRSTYPSNRAVLAAAKQQAGKAMISAIQHAYYLHAINPSDEHQLIVLSQQLGLDSQQFARDLASEELNKQLLAQISFARSLPIQGFPSLVLKVAGAYHPVVLDYKNAQVSLEHIHQLLR